MHGELNEASIETWFEIVSANAKIDFSKKDRKISFINSILFPPSMCLLHNLMFSYHGAWLSERFHDCLPLRNGKLP